MPGVYVDASYENLAATCPACNRESIYNRVSDLGTTELITGREVVCLNNACARPILIGGDTINPAYEMFFYDAAPLYEQKRYAACIINFAQAWELFVANFLRLELAYKPFVVHEDLERLNGDRERLYQETKGLTFDRLRNVLINMCIAPEISDVSTFVGRLPALKNRPPEADLAKIADHKVRTHCTTLYHTKLGELRNLVVHKSAYRPRKIDVDQYIEEMASTLLPLGHILGVEGDDVNWYVRRLR